MLHTIAFSTDKTLLLTPTCIGCYDGGRVEERARPIITSRKNEEKHGADCQGLADEVG